MFSECKLPNRRMITVTDSGKRFDFWVNFSGFETKWPRPWNQAWTTLQCLHQLYSLNLGEIASKDYLSAVIDDYCLDF